ncbi:MAG: ATPase domain-containing protein [bacterium]
MPDEERQDLEEAIAAIQAKWGVHAIRRLRQQGSVSRTATGFKALDTLLSGGLPRGRITEIAGVPTSGATTLGLRIMARAQAREEMAVYLDLEQSFDPDYAARCGVSLDRLILVRPGNLHQALSVLEEFAASNVSVLICDLHLRLLGSPDRAQALSASLERLLAPLSKSATSLIYLVSLPPATGPSPSSYPGGIALPHYATVRLFASRQRWIYRRRDIRGCRIRIHVLKNKLGKAGARVDVNVLFNDDNGDGQGNGL